MASYTIELRNVCNLYTRKEVENWFKNYELTDFLSLDQISQIQKMGTWSKDKLAKKIVNHYFMREIGFETPALFKHFANVLMQEIMEYYLPLIYSKAIEFDPLVNEVHHYQIAQSFSLRKDGSSLVLVYELFLN